MKKRKTRSQKIRTAERRSSQRSGFVVSEKTLNSVETKKKAITKENGDHFFRKDLTKTIITTAVAVIIELVLWKYFSNLF